MSELNTVKSIFAKGEELRQEIKTFGETSYTEIGLACSEFMMDVDNKYNNTKFDMNSRIDLCKEEFIKYSDNLKNVLTTKGLAYILALHNLQILYSNRINKITGDYPLALKMNGIEASKLSLKKNVLLKLPENNCIFYANYKKSIHGYNYRDNIKWNVVGDEIIGLPDGIMYSKDKYLYCQKIKDEGIWFGIGTENHFINNTLLYAHNGSDSDNAFEKVIYDGEYYKTKSIGSSLQYGYLGRFMFRNRVVYDKFTYTTASGNIVTDFKKLYMSTGEGVSSSRTHIISYGSHLVLGCNNVYTHSWFNKVNRTSDLWLKYDNYSYATTNVKWKEIQVEKNPIKTPFVTTKRDQSKIYYKDIPNRSSIIIKCKKPNPLNDTFLLYADGKIKISGKKDIREFFNREEDNVLIINLLSKKVYINGINIERDKYWFIEADSIGVIIDESLETTELSRKRYMSEIGDNTKYKGITIDEALETTELIRRGDE